MKEENHFPDFSAFTSGFEALRNNTLSTSTLKKREEKRFWHRIQWPHSLLKTIPLRNISFSYVKNISVSYFQIQVAKNARKEVLANSRALTSQRCRFIQDGDHLTYANGATALKHDLDCCVK